jgi:predicted 3-demethylubiquinone-9 3-methyltransferase (glyoxalase superfamily)
MVVTFELMGQKFMGLNGGPQFKFNPSVSFLAVCDTEAAIDGKWDKLIDGGSVLMPLKKYDWSEKYGWLQDKFGLSWQLFLGDTDEVKQKISPSLLFTGAQHGKAEEAINYYTSVFGNSNIDGILKYGAGEDEIEGTVQHAQFNLQDTVFMAMDSSTMHGFEFNEAVSFVAECDTQDDIDYYWDTLTKEGQESMCGWLKDKFGVSWQIVPTVLSELMSDPAKAPKVAEAFMQMRKFDIEKLLQAAS